MTEENVQKAMAKAKVEYCTFVRLYPPWIALRNLQQQDAFCVPDVKVDDFILNVLIHWPIFFLISNKMI